MAQEDWTDLIHTGAGTLAGRYLRTFWQPIYRVRDLESGRAVPVTIMSETFTLYRGESGQAHLVAERCAHRGTKLSTGWVEEDCLRCFYHGWKYDSTGQCVEQPGEDEAFKNKIKIKSYPLQEYLGLIFAYLGEGEPPPMRRFPDFERPGVLAAGNPEYWPCNYFNRVDNASDGAHVPWTHKESIWRSTGRRLQIASRESEETEYGVKSSSSSPGRPLTYIHFHMPNVNQNRSFARVEGSLEDSANLYVDRLFFRLPVDDESCVSFVVDLVPLTGAEGEAYRERRREAEENQTYNLHEIGDAILAGKMTVQELTTDISIYKLFWIEDYVSQCGQGPIADREHERLGKVDTGVIMIRRIWQRELKALAEGRALKQWQTPDGLADGTGRGFATMATRFAPEPVA